MTWIGIDPGLDGGIAVLRDGSVIDVTIMPTIGAANGKGREYALNDIREILDEWNDPDCGLHVAIEKQQPFSGQGVTSTFHTGYGFGVLVGICVGMRLAYSVVHARTWQARMFQGMPRGDTKAASVIVAQRLFPGISLRATERCRTAHDGMSDALLIAAYAAKEL